MGYENLRLEPFGDKVGLVTLTREKALNALDRATLGEIGHLVEQEEKAGTYRVLVLTGAGKAFVAGADIAEMSHFNAAEGTAFSRLGHERVFTRMEESSLILIAAVNGFALGGGLELAMACDMMLASDRARFGQPEVKLGLIPGFGATWRLARLVGVNRAKEILLSGEMILADEALRIGLVNRVWPGEQLLPEAKKLAETIAKNGPAAVRALKRLVSRNQASAWGSSLELEQNVFGNLFGTPEATEGMKAFLEKRPARFS